MLFTYLELTTWPLAYCLAAVFFAAFIRGYSGFGFSALLITSLSLLLEPAVVIPIVLMMEVLASLAMFPSVWKDIKWRAIFVLLLGMSLGVPLGVYALTTLPTNVTRAVISIIIMLASITLLKGYQFKGTGNLISTLGTGFLAGAVNGASGAGGLPLVIFFLASKTAAAATRASLVAIFFVLDVYTTILNAQAGLLTSLSFKRLAMFSLPLALGIFLGSRQFIASSPDFFKRFATWLLLGLAILGLARLFI